MRSPGSAYTIPVILIATAIVIGGLFTGYLVFFNKAHEPSGEKPLVVAKNDTVTVDYVGMFQDGTVFDTNIRSVAENDALYPKALSYERRSTGYERLNFTVGSRQMIAGFDDGVLGMVPGETRDIVVQPKDGYGESDPSLVKTVSLYDYAPVYNIGLSISDFVRNYSSSPQLGSVVKDAYWGLNATVFLLDQASQTLTLRYDAKVGQIVSPHVSWRSEVVSIDEAANGGIGRITLKSLLKAQDADHVKGTDSKGAQFRVVAVDVTAGTYTADYNKEVVGKTLVFRVTMVSVTKPATVKP